MPMRHIQYGNICNLLLKESKIFTVPEFFRFFLLWNLQNFLYLPTMPRNKYLLRTFSPYYCSTKYIYIYFHIWLKISVKIKILLACRKCTTQSCQSLRASNQETLNVLLIQINRFSVSNLHCTPRKNNHIFGIYENIKLGLINYTLLGILEHHGVFINSGHYVSYIRQNNKWYHCDDKHITETNLLTLSNNIYVL